MGSADSLFGLLSGALGSGLTLAVMGLVFLVRHLRAKRAAPVADELLEFRAWKTVKKHCYGGKGLYRDIVHRWNVLERERDEAREEAKQFKNRTRRLEERVSQMAARECESPLIQVVSRMRPSEMARL
jgi:hypothetical protein